VKIDGFVGRSTLAVFVVKARGFPSTSAAMTARTNSGPGAKWGFAASPGALRARPGGSLRGAGPWRKPARYNGTRRHGTRRHGTRRRGTRRQQARRTGQAPGPEPAPLATPQRARAVPPYNAEADTSAVAEFGGLSNDKGELPMLGRLRRKLTARAGNHAADHADLPKKTTQMRMPTSRIGRRYLLAGPVSGGGCCCASVAASVEAPIDERISVSAPGTLCS